MILKNLVREQLKLIIRSFIIFWNIVKAFFQIKNV